MSSELSIENNLARVNLDEEDIEVVLQEIMTHYFKEIPRKTFGHRKSHPGLFELKIMYNISRRACFQITPICWSEHAGRLFFWFISWKT